MVNGITVGQLLNFSTWVNFALALTLIFSLWWLFFTLISNREAKGGLLNASLLELLYVLALISLGSIGASFSSLLDLQPDPDLQSLFLYAVGVFLLSINLMGGLIVVPEYLQKIRKQFRVSLLLTATVFIIIAFSGVALPITYYLLGIEVILLVEIFYLNSLYYNLDREEGP